MLCLKPTFIPLAIALCFSSCGERERNESPLEIDREYRAPRIKAEIRDAAVVELITRERSAEKLENGLYRLVLPVSPTLAKTLTQQYSSGQQGADADPFAEPVPAQYTGRQDRRSLQDVLEEAGVQFPEGSSANYNKVDWTLTVVNSEEQVEHVEAYFGSLLVDYEKSIHVRVEIYELANSHVVQLIESAAHETDHTPERNAAMRAVKEGKGRLVAIPSVIGRSGQRSTVEDLTELFHPYPAAEGVEQKKESNDGTSFGTILEVDPVLGADEYTIDILIHLVHNLVSGPKLPSPLDPSQEVLVTCPKSITSQITLIDGSYRLLGNWISDEEMMQVVFLTASIQHFSETRPMVKTNSSGDPKRTK